MEGEEDEGQGSGKGGIAIVCQTRTSRGTPGKSVAAFFFFAHACVRQARVLGEGWRQTLLATKFDNEISIQG